MSNQVAGSVKLEFDGKEVSRGVAEVQRSLNKMEAQAKKVGDTLRSLKSTAIGVGTALIGIRGAADVFNRYIESTQTSSDSFAATMTATKQVVENFFVALQNNSLGSFISRLDTVIERARDLYKLFDSLNDMRLAGNFSHGAAQLALEKYKNKGWEYQEAEQRLKALKKTKGASKEEIAEAESTLAKLKLEKETLKKDAEAKMASQRKITNLKLQEFTRTITKAFEAKVDIPESEKWKDNKIEIEDIEGWRTYGLVAGYNEEYDKYRNLEDERRMLHKQMSGTDTPWYMLAGRKSVESEALKSKDSNDKIQETLKRIAEIEAEQMKIPKAAHYRKVYIINDTLSDGKRNDLSQTMLDRDMEGIQAEQLETKKHRGIRIDGIDGLNSKQAKGDRKPIKLKPLKPNSWLPKELLEAFGGFNVGAKKEEMLKDLSDKESLLTMDLALSVQGSKAAKALAEDLRKVKEEKESIERGGLDFSKFSKGLGVDIKATYIKQLEDMQKAQEKAAEGARTLGDAIGGVGSIISNIGSLFGDETGQMVQGLASVVDGIAKAVPAFQALTIAKAANSAAETPVVGWINAIAAITSVVAAFAALPKFETGGIVGGSSYYGDKLLVRANSGELILNQAQQRSLYNQMEAARSGSVEVGGEFRIKGGDLVATIQRTTKNKGRN